MSTPIPRQRGTQSWNLSLLGPDGTLRTLDLIEDTGSDDWQAGRPSPHGMGCTLGTDPGNLRGQLVRCTYHWDNGTRSDTHILGTWVPTACKPRYTAHGATWRIDGIDRTIELVRAKLRRPLTLPTASPVAEAARTLAGTHAPTLPVVIPDTDETLRAPLTWDAGTSVLTVTNDLLEAAGYGPLHPQPDGTVISSRLTPASQRPVSMRWSGDSADAPFVPQLDLEDGYLDVPNEVIARVTGTGPGAGLVGYWSDPLDIATTGVRSTTIDVDATSQAAANAQARTHGLAQRAWSTRTTLSGPWQPITPGDVAEIQWHQHSLSRRVELVGRSTKWAPATDTTYQLQEAL